MTFSFEDCLTPEEILADVLVAVDDEKLKRYTKGWYIRQIKTGLETINFNAPFLPMSTDVDITANLIIPIPSGVWNTIDLFIWNPTDDCENKCQVGEVIRLFHKRNVQSNGYQKGYFARNIAATSDLYLPVPYGQDATVYYYNVVMGNYQLSDACAEYEKLRIIHYGYAKEISNTKFIPPFLREYLVAHATEVTFRMMKAKDIKYRPLHADAFNDLHGRRGTEPSKFDKAESYMKRVDKKQWTDLSDYLNRLP